MNTIPQNIEFYIRQHILPLYTQFDKAHQVDHAEYVIKESLSLAKYYEVNLTMVYTIAAYHDIGLCKGREFHHIVSGEMLYNDPQLKNWFTSEQLTLMKEAVEDHRASNQHEPRSIYGKIVAEADRLIDMHTTLKRTVQYGLSNYPEMSKEEQYQRFKNYILNKYGQAGYLKLWIPESNNALRLEKFRELIHNESELRKSFDLIFEKESNIR